LQNIHQFWKNSLQCNNNNNNTDEVIITKSIIWTPQFTMCCIYLVRGQMTCMNKTRPLNAIPQDFIPQFLFNTTDNADRNAGYNVTTITYFTNATAFQTGLFYLY
jgi:hypothetical protein